MKSLINLVNENKNLKFVDPEKKVILNYHEFDGSINLFNAREKDLAFLYADNSINSIIAFWQIFKSIHTVVLLSPQLNANFKITLEKIYAPAFIFDPTREHIEGYSWSLNAERGKINWLIADYQKKKYIHPEVKLLLSTSGTTGSPKFVKLSEANLIANAQSILSYLPIQPNDVTPLNLPIYYSYGLSILITNSVKGGTIICTTKDILNPGFWEDFSTQGYTSLAGVPFVYEMLDRIGFIKKSYPSLRYLTQAGGKLNSKTLDKFTHYSLEHGVPFFVMYGQTEATARMAYLDPKVLPHKKGSIGKPIPQGHFSIDPETEELLYRGPNVFGGYATCLSDLETFDQDQELKTGDIARMDEDGYLFITGRIKRFVKIFGARINLDEVEQILKDEFNSTFCCCGLQDKFILIVSDNLMLNKADIANFIRIKLDIHPSALKFEKVSKFPLTPNGKIDYFKLIELYGA